MAKNDDFCAIGTVITQPVFSHKVGNGEDFYFFFVMTKRFSGTLDKFKCLVSHKLTSEIEVGNEIEIYGEVRTFNKWENGKSRLNVFVLVKEVYNPHIEAVPENRALLDGFIVKPPILRITPLTKKWICDTTIAINHGFGVSSYIPCVFWGKCAKAVSEKKVGDRVLLRGRLQSREYMKDGDLKTAYEVSVSEFEEGE